MTKFVFCFCAGLINAWSVCGQKNFVTIAPDETEASIIRKAAQVVPSPRQLRWQQLELTAFFHFGINTFTNREWGTGKEDPFLFHPTQLDARQWVRTCKEAGIRQVILTAKHHDGFCLWPSAYTKHSVASSPWKEGRGDVVREVRDACRLYGLGFGVYLSPWDRHAPEYGTEAYNDYFVNQLTELLTRYGKVDEVWFDGANGEGPNGKKQVYDFARWYRVIRTLQPEAVIAIMGPDVRWVGTESGHGRETEWSVVPVDVLDPGAVAASSQQAVLFQPKGDMTGDDLGSREKIRNARSLVWYPAETDVSIRPGWFYHPEEDSLVKSPGNLLDIYFHSVGRNGVLLLNIPPNREGRISSSDVRSLQQWKLLRDQLFRTNYLKGSKAKEANIPTGVLTDGKLQTDLVPADYDSIYQLELELKAPATVNVLLLQENITRGQRIERFELRGWINGAWTTLSSGTTVGYKRMLRFPSTTVRRLQLRILSSRLAPHLAEMGLYHLPQD